MVDAHVMKVIAQFEAKTSRARAALNTFNKQADTAKRALEPLQKRLKTQKTGLNNLKNQLDYEKDILNSQKDISKETKAQTRIGFKERLRGAQEEIDKTKERISQQKKTISESQKGANQQKRVINDLNRKRESEISKVERESKKQSEAISKSINARRKQIAASTSLANKQSEIQRVMKATGMGANDSARAISNLGFTFNKSGQAVDALGNRMKLTNKTISDMRASTRRFNMSMLSLMFASMALNRALGGFLRSSIKAYNKANEENSDFRKATNRLTAAWEFFKYSLIDALAQSDMFRNIVGFVVNLINQLNKLPPKTKSIIAMGIGFLFVATMIMMVVGQVGLAQNAFQSMGNAMFRAKDALGLSSWWSFVAVIALILALVIGAVKGFKIFRKAREDAEKPDGVISLAEAFKWLGFVVEKVLYMLGIGFSVIFTLFESSFTYFQVVLKTVSTNFKLMALNIKLNIKKVINWVINKILSMAQKIVSIWNGIRKAFGKEPISVDFSRLEEFRRNVGDTQDKIKNLKDELKDYAGESHKYVGELWTGLANETPNIRELASNVTQQNEAMRDLPTREARNRVNNIADNRQINFTVNAGPEMDEEELANRILEKQEDEISLGIGSSNE